MISKLGSLIIGLSVLMVIGCTKTEKLSHEPDYHILQFQVPTGYGNINGAIDEDSNRITIQLPYYLYDLIYINPDIKIAEGATISPASGERINLNGSPTTYTVKAANGATSMYTVKREYLQLATTIHELSTATATTTFRMAGMIQLTGTNLIADTGYVKILLNKPGGTPLSFTPSSISKSDLYFTIPDNNKTDTGLYYVTVKNLAATVQLKYPVLLKYPVPVLEMDSYRDTVKQGETFTVNGYYIRNIDSFAIYKGSGSTSLTSNYNFLAIQSYNNNQITFKVPDDFPVGSYPVSPGILRTWQKFTDTAFFRTYSGSQLAVQSK